MDDSGRNGADSKTTLHAQEKLDRKKLEDGLQNLATVQTRREAMLCCENVLSNLDSYHDTYVKPGVTKAEDLIVKKDALKNYLADLKAMKNEDYTPDMWKI